MATTLSRCLRPVAAAAAARVGDHQPGAHRCGAWVQVSRLGMPLVNEVVIGLQDQDKFDASRPSGDGQFVD